jgi:hypothetical protein
MKGRISSGPYLVSAGISLAPVGIIPIRLSRFRITPPLAIIAIIAPIWALILVAVVLGFVLIVRIVVSVVILISVLLFQPTIFAVVAPNSISNEAAYYCTADHASSTAPTHSRTQDAAADSPQARINGCVVSTIGSHSWNGEQRRR